MLNKLFNKTKRSRQRITRLSYIVIFKFIVDNVYLFWQTLFEFMNVCFYKEGVHFQVEDEG